MSFEPASGFNPRSREGSDVVIFGGVAWMLLFQSTLPRGERPKTLNFFTHIRAVSIHAPARGATVSRCWKARPGRCFNPRSREGSDASKGRQRHRRRTFQSTLPRGERLLMLSLVASILSVSIHAPARGATRNVDGYWRVDDVSIHAPARGATCTKLSLCT